MSTSPPNGLSVEIEDPVQTGGAFVAANNVVHYSVSPGALVITQGFQRAEQQADA